MEDGKKFQTLTLGETTKNPDSSIAARNLNAEDLGSVIYDAIQSTIKECLQKKLFIGLSPTIGIEGESAKSASAVSSGQKLKDIEHHKESFSTSAMDVTEQSSVPHRVTETQIPSEINQLRHEMEEVKALLMNQSTKITALKTELACLKIEHQEVKDFVKLLKIMLKDSSREKVDDQTGTNGCNHEKRGSNSCEKTTREATDEPQLGIKEVIFMMGGCDDDYLWLSSLDYYSTNTDVVRGMRPMGFPRSYSSAAVSNGFIYNFGGCADQDRGLWCDTAERYNPWNNEWISCPPLSERKGSLASAVFDNKIFAFGGSNGAGCFSKVEMFDPALGRWITTQSMLQKVNFSSFNIFLVYSDFVISLAAELNGVLYVAGGCDGDCYIKSAERFDPREVSWSRLPNMNTSRAAHFIAVLNGKLYVLGGFDGEKMVASVEVFDTRMGTWMLDDEMMQPRGYCFAPVIDEKIYTIGGMTEHGVFAEKVQRGAWLVSNEFERHWEKGVFLCHSLLKW